jgi:predicted transcriptional regulator
MTRSPLANGAGVGLRKPNITKNLARTVMEKCAGKKWRSLREIADIAGISQPAASGVMHNIQTNRKHHVKVETKRVGKEVQYRIFKQDKTVSVDELTEKLTPIIDGLIAEGRKNMATMVPATVAMLAAKLKRLLDEWAE